MIRRAVPAAVVCLVFSATSANAKPYPVNQCVSQKQTDAARYCGAALSAWGDWLESQDDAARDASLGQAADGMIGAWEQADARSAGQGSDCVDTTLSAGDALDAMDVSIAGIVDEIALGLVPGTAGAACGGALLDAAAKKCARLLRAEGQHIGRLSQDADGTQLSRSQSRASDGFERTWAHVLRSGCLTAATEESIEAQVDALSADLVLQTIVSPNVDDSQFTTYSPTPGESVEYLGRELTPTCIKDTPYHFFAKRGSVNKLLMYYQGGGACWEQLTCSIPVCKSSVSPTGDSPNNFSSGFADLSNPDNPFRDWHIVFVSYCSCDVHFGDAHQDYAGGIEHRGYQNARFVEKWAREHFVNPEVVFATGSSAGAYGAIFHGPTLQMDAWPASQFHVLADAGNGVITADFLQNEFENWNFRNNLPSGIRGLRETIDDGTGTVGYMEIVTQEFPDTTWAHYSSAFDGGTGGQTGFYNVMLNDNDPIAALTWWEGSCAFNEVMRDQAFSSAAFAPENYRYYIGTGSRHTMWGSNKVYGDTTGGVPTIVAWINGMLASGSGMSDPAWTNVEANPFNVLLPGDVQPPVIPTLPFEASGSDVVVNCD